MGKCKKKMKIKGKILPLLSRGYYVFVGRDGFHECGSDLRWGLGGWVGCSPFFQ